MNVQINSILSSSYVNGPGCRTVLFFQGCDLACPGCQNFRLWDRRGGETVEYTELIRRIEAAAAVTGTKNLTFSGGEPFQSPVALACLAAYFKQKGYHLLSYSGYTLDELLDERHLARLFLGQILGNLDILVDGRFIASLDDPMITWRGSRNQRVIDIPATLEREDLTLLDWDEPEIILTETGDAYLPIGLAPDFAEVGETRPTKRCGETPSRFR